ncbi:MAG: hypothetical protein COV74_01355 [Candidatus Omnitrophica bacterium CG11_big_fil_rev_8_21_14_0_20_45_26]|uniref:Recombinase family protein n=1 Tax=Candidatus Abzuiibacterium crystallinum TaxID=1974748 RepID=A0A2H0LS68_9BACT|nr:MAG: hypothetical protein COV74_01355 [Candidatus Omnitrophica bacterium CG11_big_fil_rev_8_21_14_0_20_45_26]PIW64817.1 MAG: hypothetical protein COW12_04765 [Candidatus Omnitrophica bacterium CG12_big_fil_rev_8_21_14_0_65_45_16]
MTRTRVALYTRVSTEEQKENYSLAAQLELLKKFAADHKYEVYDEYVDGGYSGTVYERPAFQRLIRDAHHKKFDAILVYRLDRFFRNNKALLTVSEDLEKFGVAIRSITEPFDSSTYFGKFALSLFGSIAQLERDTFLERSKVGRLRRAKEGFYSGTQPTKFGFDYDKESKKLKINEKEAETIRLIFRLYNEPESSLVKVVRRLRQLRLKTKEGKEFISSTVHDILRDSVYVGKWYANKYSKGGRLKPSAEWILVEVPVIVSIPVFESAQKLLQVRKNYSVRNAKYKYLLQGLVKCGDCGNTVAGTADKQITVKNGKKYGPYLKLYYRCTHFVKNLYGKSINCNLRYMQGAILESVVWKEVEKILLNPMLIMNAVRREQKMRPAKKESFSNELIKVKRRIEDLHCEEERILEAYRESVIDLRQLKDQTAKIKGDAGLFQNRAKELEFELQKPEDNNPKGVIDYLKKMRQGLGALSYETKKKILHLFNTAITANVDGSIDIRCFLPNNLNNEKDETDYFSCSELSKNELFRCEQSDPECFGGCLFEYQSRVRRQAH